MCAGCNLNQPIVARGLCRACYTYHYKHDTLDQFAVKTFRQKFDAHYTKGPGCWLWHGGRNEYGYGTMVDASGHILRAHRLMWEFVHGEIPADGVIAHKCDNPPCVNPKHLFLTDRGGNNRDAKRKGRNARGERNGHAKFTEQQVQDIKRDQRTQVALAAAYGVTQSTISRLKSGKRWCHLK